MLSEQRRAWVLPVAKIRVWLRAVTARLRGPGGGGLIVVATFGQGVALACYLLAQWDLAALLRDRADDAFYYFQIARNLAAGEFSTFDGGITRTNGYHPLWLLLITPMYWVFDERAALFAIKVFEILLIAGGAALIAAAARLARLPWLLFLAVPTVLYQQRGMLLGLEAAAAAAMLGLLVFALVLVARDSRRWTWLLAAIAFALPWVRLELAAVSVMATAALCLLEGTRPRYAGHGILRAARSRPVVPLVAACAGVLLYFAYNALVFGGPVPVSAATKQFWAQQAWVREGGYSLAEQVREFLRTWPFDDELFVVLETCVYLPLVWWLARGSRSPNDRLALVFLAGIFSISAGHAAKFAQSVVTVHPDHVIQPWYVVPAYLMTALLVPVRACVAVLAIRHLVEPRAPRAAGVMRLGVVASAAMFLLVTTDFNRPFRAITGTAGSSVHNWQIVSYTGAQVMNRVLPEGSVIGSRDAGVIGYFSRFPVVNLDGLVNSHEYLRVRRHLYQRPHGLGVPLQQYQVTKFGLTHFANAQPIDHRINGTVFEGVTTSHPTGDGRFREFKLWSAAALDVGVIVAEARAGAFGGDTWLWDQMAPRFDYHRGDVGVLVDDGLAQVIVRNCVTKHLQGKAFGFSFVARDGAPGQVSFRWDNPRKNHLGFCVTVFDLPHDVAHVVTTSAAVGYTVRNLGNSRVKQLVGETGWPIIYSEYDVYLHENTLVYVTERCTAADTDTRFFLHVTPADPSDLPDHRRRQGFENLDFDFSHTGTKQGDWCVVTRALPAYGISRVTTGQFVPGRRRVWGETVDFPLSQRSRGMGAADAGEGGR